MKPWDELSDVEKREAIALRIRWSNIEEPLPDWPTNDGLAFAEVWPKLTAIKRDDIFLGVAGDTPTVGQFVNNEVGDLCIDVLTQSSTWADAICRAAYSLLGGEIEKAAELQAERDWPPGRYWERFYAEHIPGGIEEGCSCKVCAAVRQQVEALERERDELKERRAPRSRQRDDEFRAWS